MVKVLYNTTVFHNYSYKSEDLLWTNHWRDRVRKNAKHGQEQGALFSVIYFDFVLETLCT
jgi:hypothetical protein